jgi:Recombination endonuclease VII
MKQFCLRGHDTFIVGRRGSTCRVCHNQRNTEWRIKNPHKYRTMQRDSHWKGVGILNSDGSLFTTVDFDRAYQIQSGRCLGCGKHQTELKTFLHADHDHKTGVFRRLLCGGCNRIIGIASENPDLLRKLADLL